MRITPFTIQLRRLLLLTSAMLLVACATVAPSREDGREPAERCDNVISIGLLAPGMPHETPYFIRESGVTGPTVLVVGGVHGNEPAGALAADQIRQWTIRRGRLVVVPRANPPALAAGTRRTPDKPPELGDLNRNFPAAIVDDDGTDTDTVSSPRGTIAPTLWAFAVEVAPDWLLDLHEGFAIHRINPQSVGSSIIHVDEPWIRLHVDLMLTAVNEEIADPQRHFVSLGRRSPINTSLARAATAHLGAVGMTLETTWRDQPISLRARQHRRMVHRLLADLGMLDDPASAHAPAMPAMSVIAAVLAMSPSESTERHHLRVALVEDCGVDGESIERLAQRVAAMPDAIVTHLSAADIRDGVLAHYDVVLLVGESTEASPSDLCDMTHEAIRRFVADGGGLVSDAADEPLLEETIGRAHRHRSRVSRRPRRRRWTQCRRLGSRGAKQAGPTGHSRSSASGVRLGIKLER